MKLFLDTNVFLHYKPLNELNLPELVGSKSVTVVFPGVTIRELDDHKARNSVRKIKDRAARIIKQVEMAKATDSPLEGDIQVELFPKHPKKFLEEHDLNPAWNDDVLIASVMAYRDMHPDDEIAVISQDFGVRVKCHEYGITPFELSSELLLPETLDEAEIEARKTRQELERLKSALPKLRASFVNGSDSGATLRVTIPPVAAVDEGNVERQVAAVREKYPPMGLRAPGSNTLIGVSPILGITSGEIARYNGELEEFYDACSRYFRELHEFNEVAKGFIRFGIQVSNEGTAPAEDVDVLFHFPDGFTLTDEDGLPAQPDRPKPPNKPTSLAERLSQPSTYIPSLMRDRLYDIPNFSPKPAFKIKKSNSYEVSDHFNRIKHGMQHALPDMYVIFPSRDAIKSFSCTYQLRPANAPDPVKGELHFIIEVQ